MSGNDLADFLLARLDEDEVIARAANPGPWTWVGSLRPRVASELKYGAPGPNGWGTVLATSPHDVDATDADHIARWDPAAVLADCAAKRAVVEVLAKQAAACPPDDWPEDGEIMKAPLADNARHLLRLLVQPYSGHPHFHPSWAVD